MNLDVVAIGAQLLEQAADDCTDPQQRSAYAKAADALWSEYGRAWQAALLVDDHDRLRNELVVHVFENDREAATIIDDHIMPVIRRYVGDEQGPPLAVEPPKPAPSIHWLPIVAFVAALGAALFVNLGL